jgi:hypothetical protein
MPKLILSLREKDHAFLQMVANHWDIDLPTGDESVALQHLIDAMSRPENIRAAFGRLPEEARDAIASLLERESRLAWGQFTREHGELREMGPAKRDRERPDLNPKSPVELLWYRAMISKDFFDLPPEPQEFAYIPDELIETLSALCHIQPIEWGRPATPGECAHPILANDYIIDQATDYLAASRTAMEMNQWSHFRTHWQPEMAAFLRELLYAAYLLDDQYLPMSENVRDFVVGDRARALAELAAAWMRSKSINELKLVPSLLIEDELDNNPHGTRQKVLNLLTQVPNNKWWSLESFIDAVYQHEPDFQRPGGSYQAWFIKERGTNALLSGFNAWHEVDGALLHFLITAPMHWLGFFDLASEKPGGEPTAFRYSAWAESLWSSQPPQGLTPDNKKINVALGGEVSVPRHAPRWLRYQIARFCEWQSVQGEGDALSYHFRVTPRSLKRASTQGLKPTQLVKLLQANAESPPPQGFENAVENWEKGGTQALMQSAKLLRFTDASVLQKLKESEAAHLIREELNDTTVRVNAHDAPEIIRLLAAMGILVNEE